jgi:hypothetical protein
LFLVTQSQNPKNIRQVKEELADLRKIIKEVLAEYKKVREIKAQDSVLTAITV